MVSLKKRCKFCKFFNDDPYRGAINEDYGNEEEEGTCRKNAPLAYRLMADCYN